MTTHILHEPVDELDPQPIPVSAEAYERIKHSFGAVIEGPADDEVVWFNGWSYSKAAS